MNLVRKAQDAKIKKNLFSTMDFPQIWCTRLSFKFWVFLDFLQILTCDRHTIFQYILVKSDLCSLRPFLKRMPNIKITTKNWEFLRFSVYFHQIVPIRFRLEGYIFSMSITACFHYNTDSWVDVISVNFNSKKVNEDEFFDRQDILWFFSDVSKDYKYVKSAHAG